MARLVFTSPFLSPAVGISRMGMGAHWSSCPVGDSTSVNPSSHMQMPACRGQHRIMLQVVLGHDSSPWMVVLFVAHLLVLIKRLSSRGKAVTS